MASQTTPIGIGLLQWLDTLPRWQSFGTSSSVNPNEQGQDFQVPLNTPVPGIAGVVTAINTWYAATGDYAVSIRDALGNVHVIGHISPTVKVGDVVSNGQTIGLSGGAFSPISTGPHIEYQFHPGGGTAINPIPEIQQAAAPNITQLLQQAGFTGQALVTAVSIAWAESGFNPAATHTNSDGSIDRGIFQINNRAWPNIPDSVAFDPAQAAKAVFAMSGGTVDGLKAIWHDAQGNLSKGFSAPSLAVAQSLVNGQTTQDQVVQQQAQGQVVGNINVPINLGPWQGNISLPNPINWMKGVFTGAERVFWLLVGILCILVGLWLLVEGSKQRAQ